VISMKARVRVVCLFRKMEIAVKTVRLFRSVGKYFDFW